MELLLSAVEEDGHQRGDEHFSPQTLGPRAQHWQVCLPSVPPPSGGMSLQAKAAGVHKTAGDGGGAHREQRVPWSLQQVKVGPPPSRVGEKVPRVQHAGTGPAHTGLGRECLNSWGEGRVQRCL